MGEKIKVGILIPGFNIFGQEKALLSIADALRNDGMEVTVFVHDIWGNRCLKQHLIREGIPYFSLPFNTIWSIRLLARNPWQLIKNLWGVWRSSRTFQQHIDQFGLDALISGNWSFSFYLLPALMRVKIPLIYRHGDEPPKSSFVSRKIAQLVFSRASIHVANCKFVSKSLRSHYNINDVIVIRNLVSAASLLSSNLQNSEGRVERLLYAGQLSEHKGVRILLDAFDILAVKYPHIELVIAGTYSTINEFAPNPIRDRINSSIERWGSRVCYVGHVPDIGVLFTNNTVHVCPSIWEDPSPNVILEAKAHSAPTVAFHRGGIPELIQNGIDGFVLHCETPESLSTAISALIDDDQLFFKTRLAAREHLDEICRDHLTGKPWSLLINRLVSLGRVAEAGSEQA